MFMHNLMLIESEPVMENTDGPPAINGTLGKNWISVNGVSRFYGGQRDLLFCVKDLRIS